MENGKNGCLYIVATPIGNLEDISFRALKMLNGVDLIAAEDTRHTLKLLNHFNIKKPLISYYEHNKRERGSELISRLKNGNSVALVTDAGTPGISDPGEDIVKLAIENDIPVVMIPGPTALITGLVLSGLPCGRFCFEGFLPHRKKERIKRLESIRSEERTIVFYITPHRALDVLRDMLSVLGNRKSALCRELTKTHEEIIRGTLSKIIETLSSRDSIKGEMVLVVEGEKMPESLPENEFLSLSVTDHIEQYISHGLNLKDAMKQVAKDRGVSKSDVYSEYIREKNGDE
ncbi:MAG: 16S rRNA (cytidine(1402)-2'-O)-methyltransferase [Clostridiaceae bacterium]|nr:16S rRNA (cytidine(1402)-2'-O)-methyltransferase [Clostridiaceae bacterium]